MGGDELIACVVQLAEDQSQLLPQSLQVHFVGLLVGLELTHLFEIGLK
jgi:hypothetical protein